MLYKNLYKSDNVAWAFVVFGGIVECFWVSGLKYSHTPLQYGLTALGITISFFSMIIATKRLEVGVCYSVFVGIGTAGVVLSEILVFGVEFSFLKIFLIFTLLLGVVGLKLVDGKKDSNKKDSNIESNTTLSGGLRSSGRIESIESKSPNDTSTNTYNVKLDSIESSGDER